MIQSINDYLKSLERQSFDAYQALLEEGKNVTATILKDKIVGKTEKKFQLISIME